MKKKDTTGRTPEIGDKSSKMTNFFNNKYYDLVESLPEIVFELDVEGHIIYINKRVTELLGYSREELIGLNCFDFIIENEQELATSEINEIVQRNRKYSNIEHRIQKKDGTILPVYVYTTYIEKDDEITGIRGIAISILDTLQAENELSKNEKIFRPLIENSSEVIMILDRNGIVKFVSPSIRRIGGFDPENMIDINVFEFVHSEDRPAILNIFFKGINNANDSVTTEVRYLNIDRTLRNAELTACNMLDNPLINGIVLNVRDITDRKEVAEELRVSEEKFRTMIEYSSETIIIMDINGKLIYATQSLANMVGFQPEELVGASGFDRIHPDDQPRIMELFSNGVKNNEALVVTEYRYKHSDGLWHDTEAKARVMLDNPLINGVLINLRDITEQKKAEKALRESEEKFRTMIENSSEVICIIDANAIIQYISPSTARVFGFSPEEMLGEIAFDFVHDEDREMIINIFLHAVINKRKHQIVEFRGRHHDGALRINEVSASNMLENPIIKGIVLNIRDITERKKAEEKAFYYEFHDPLTQLPNREMFLSQLDVAITKAQRRESIFAIMCIGIDKFKNINDMYGASIGDKILQKVGLNLKRTFRDDDIVSRFGDDRFMILFSDIGSSDDVVDIIQKTFNIFSDPYVIESNIIRVTSSIGVCLYPHDGENKELLLKNSEAAMYMAKKQGRNTYRLFDASMNAEMMTRVQIEKELEFAIYNNEFIAHYQPKVDRNGSILGMESLIRWESPKYEGLLLPSNFINIAEKNGMITEIGDIILYQTCIQNKKWQDLGYPPKRVSVNISPFEFKQQNLIPNIKNVIKRTRLEPKWLELEITESGIMENEKESIEKLNEIHNMGISISIDDFGTGYSSLSKLKDYPVDTLKIDQSFIKNLPNNKKSSTITTTIIDLAHNLGFKVVAEGVEKREQLDFLDKHHCDQYQGNLFSAPLSSKKFEEILKCKNYTAKYKI